MTPPFRVELLNRCHGVCFQHLTSGEFTKLLSKGTNGIKQGLNLVRLSACTNRNVLNGPVASLVSAQRHVRLRFTSPGFGNKIGSSVLKLLQRFINPQDMILVYSVHINHAVTKVLHFLGQPAQSP